MKKASVVHFFASLTILLLTGALFLFIGASVGGNFGFPDFGGLRGYEAAGAVFLLIGMPIGAWLGIWIGTLITKSTFSKLMVFIALTVLTIASMIIYNERTAAILMPSLLLLLPLTATIANSYKS